MSSSNERIIKGVTIINPDTGAVLTIPAAAGDLTTTQYVQTYVEGLTGIAGLQGMTGVAGVTGLEGVTGVDGTTGIQGTTGAQGVGSTGVQGVTGSEGVTGIQGATGVASPDSSIIYVYDQPLNFGTFGSPEGSFNAGTFLAPEQTFDAGTFSGSPSASSASPNEFFINQSDSEIWNYSDDWNDVLSAPATTWSLNGSVVYYNAGSVGIGTNDPSNLFTVQQAVDSSYASVQTYGFILANGAGSNNQIVGIGADSSGGLIQSWQSLPLLLNPAGNNVGISTQSPAYTLDVGGFIHSSDNINADANVTANQGVYGQTLNINNGNGATGHLINANSGVGVILEGVGSGSSGYLRIVANAGGWSDEQEATYFQIHNTTNNNAAFMGGLSGSDTTLDRLQFCSKFTSITDFSWNDTPAPSHILEISLASGGDKPLLSISDFSGAPGNFLEINSQFHSGGDLFVVDSAGDVTVKGLISANGGLALGDGSTRQTLWLAGSGDYNHAIYNNSSGDSEYDYSGLAGNVPANNDGEVFDYDAFLVFQNRGVASAISYFDTSGNLYVGNNLTVQSPGPIEDHSSFIFTGGGLNDASDGFTSYSGSYPATETFTVAAVNTLNIYPNAGGIGPNPAIGDTIVDNTSSATGTVVYTDYGSGYFAVTVTSGTFNASDSLTDSTNGWTGSINFTEAGGDVIGISGTLSISSPLQIAVGGAGIGMGYGIQINWASGVGHTVGNYWTLSFTQTQPPAVGFTVDGTNRNYLLGDISDLGNGTSISIDDSTSTVSVDGSLDMNSNPVTNVPDPINPQDPVTLNYFNNHAAVTSQTTVTLQPSDIGNLNSTPFQLVAASGDVIIVPLSVEFYVVSSATAYTTTANLFLNTTGNFSGAPLWPAGNTSNNGNIGLLTSNTRNEYRYIPVNLFDFAGLGVGEGIFLQADAAITGGTGTLVVRTTWQSILPPS